MRVLALIAGILCLLTILFDAFQTIILPRRATGRFRITRMFYILTWNPWAFIARRIRHPRRRETFFSYYGPLSLILLLMVWAAAMVVGFGLLYYAAGSPLNDAAAAHPGLRTDLYISGTTIFTLGLGDVTPHSAWSRAIRSSVRPSRSLTCTELSASSLSPRMRTRRAPSLSARRS